LNRLHTRKRVHLVGAGGIGMGGVAIVLHSMGYQVTGSDISNSIMVKHLRKIGISITNQHSAKNVTNVDLVVFSSAISPDNVEIVAAVNQGIAVVSRASILADIMRLRDGIAVAGTHGKTTTSSLIVSILLAAEDNPSFVIGGFLNNLGTTARYVDGGRKFVVEADESDASFHCLHPIVSVVTNIDNDHMATYNNDFANLKENFLRFLQNLPFYGLAVLCLDDEHVGDIYKLLDKPAVTYGFNPSAHVQAVNRKQYDTSCTFDVLRADKGELKITMPVLGDHNIRNALAAIAVADYFGIESKYIQSGLANFQGNWRRLQKHGKVVVAGKVATLFDDYGHHPTEVQAVILALRAAFPKQRIVTIFQPHKFSRTKSLLADFAKVLAQAEELILLDVFPAGESPIIGGTSLDLAQSVQQHGITPKLCQDIDKIAPILEGCLQDGDIIVTQGAGDISKVALSIKQQFATKEQIIKQI